MIDYNIIETDPVVVYLSSDTLMVSDSFNSLTKWKNKCILENSVFLKLPESKYIIALSQSKLTGLWSLDTSTGVVAFAPFNLSSLLGGKREYMSIPANALVDSNIRIMAPMSSKSHQVESLAKELLMKMITQPVYKNIESTVLTVKAIKIADSFIENMGQYKSLQEKVE